MKKSAVVLFLILLLAKATSAQTKVAAKDASKHIGQLVSITERAFYGKKGPSGEILIYFGGYNPAQLFTVIIGTAFKSKFKGNPATAYKGKDLTVIGKLVNYQGRPAIEVTDPAQLKLVLVDNMHGAPLQQH